MILAAFRKNFIVFASCGLLLLVEDVVSQNSDVIDDLVAAQVIFRHGARTPEVTFPSDPYGDLDFWPNGFHQLTCIGKVQCYNLGRFLRSRFNGWLNSTYVRKEINVLSSDVDRTLQSAYAVNAGLYPSQSDGNSSSLDVGEDCEAIPWNSVPVHAAPGSIDNIVRQEAPCPLYDNLLSDFYSTSPEVKGMVEKNWDIIAYFAKNANISGFTSIPQLAKYYDALIVERYFNLTLPTWADDILDSEELRELTLFYFQTLSYTEQMKMLRTGPLLNKIVENFGATLSNSEDGKLLYLISGHDHTLTTFLHTLGLYSNDTRPSFASAIILQLHNSGVENDHYIKLFYRRNDEDFEGEELEIPSCPQPCYYSQFLRVIQPYRLSQREWEEQCSMKGSAIFRLAMWFLVFLAIIGVIAAIIIFCRSILSARKKKRPYAQLD